MGAAGGLAYTGFPAAAAIILGLVLVLAGLVLLRLVVVRRAPATGVAVPFVAEPPSVTQ